MYFISGDAKVPSPFPCRNEIPGRGQVSTRSMSLSFSLSKLPATIAVELRPGDGKGWADVKVTHADAGAGTVEISGIGDIDDSKTTQLENIHLLSRWTSAGSGRADIELKNGDLPFTVTARECWSTSFERVYYQDTVNFEPATGQESSCALPAAP